MSPDALLAGLSLSLIILVVGLSVLLRWGSNWGSTAAERVAVMPGDRFLTEGTTARVVMTRSITIKSRPETVWPWLAQLGRGAGWYSLDRLDNGGKSSARHVVTWIPAPAIGDASAIGYLRHIEAGRSLVWWASDVKFAGARASLVVDLLLAPQGEGARLVIRMSAGAEGILAPVALFVFRVIDTIMACRQLTGIRERAEHFGSRSSDPAGPETGRRDQYQLYQTIYASGDSAGVEGREHAARWRQLAFDDGVLGTDPGLGSSSGNCRSLGS